MVIVLMLACQEVREIYCKYGWPDAYRREESQQLVVIGGHRIVECLSKS